MDNATTGASDKRGLSNGPSFRRSPRPCEGPPLHHLSPHHLPPSVTTITISKDDATGYGMKISGDNPVYVQSVKAGGAAERAGLQSGDTIIKVNGINVTNLTHTEVVELIKAAAQVILTVQQFPLLDKSVGAMASPTLPSRHLSHTLQSQSRDRITAPQPVDHEKLRQLEHQKTHTLNLMLEKEQRYVDSLRSQLAKGNDSGLESKLQKTLIGAERRVQTLLQQLEQEGMEAPPLPCRNRRPHLPSSPPPLPPRQYLLHQEHHNYMGASPQIHTHQRTKSSPDTLQSNMSLAEATKRLIASESMSELTSPKRSKGGLAWEVETPRRATTPPGTPPPPYPTGQSPDDTYSHITDDDLPRSDTSALDTSDHSPMKGFSNFLIQSANQMQQPIISMEDEDMSDQEVNQMEDHGPFKSLSKLWNHQAHLAVFLNYVISNSDPSSLLFYLVTDLYKEGSAKEMKKWAYEIHSSFLVPGAPLRLNNVDENVAREIDDVLLKEFDKEEILRKIFWKARQKAKEELNEQLTDFQAKRTAGLGTLFGPKDSELEESIHDKNKETKIIESILVPKMEPYLEDIEKSVIDDRRFSTGAALGTVLGKVFGIKGQHFNSLLERCPTYVSKDKSLLKAKLIGKNRKMTRKGHICVAYQYYTVTYCNHCQLIIWGIGPQGYQCSNCGLNIHRHCVNVLEEYCPGPMVKKERGNDRISKLMEKIRPENTKRKPSSLNFAQVERAKRLQEEESADHDSGDRGGPKGPGDKRPDPVRESEEKGGRQTPHEAADDANHHLHDISQHVTKTKPNSASINRSESYKERIHQKRQLRERRKTSDPNLSKSNNDVEVDAQTLSFKSNSGSSSNSSLSTRSLESPSNSLEGVGASQQQQQNQLQQSQNQQQPWDSDFDDEADRSDWTTSVPEEVHKSLSSKERKRQEVINELFYTERSHVMGLKVLDRVFYKPMQEQHILSPDQLQLLFANLEEMIAFHSQLNSVMKEKRKENPIVGEVGQLLLDHFDGAGGESFKKAAAIFCAKQQIALEQLKEKRKKDPKLNTFLLDAEMNPRCRRLQLKDMLSKGWLRLTKYPLLFENIAKNTTSNDEEREKVNTAFERSKEILNHVDMAVKEAEDQNRLAEIQKRLDKSGFDKNENALAAEFKNLDLSRHKLVYEGSLTWRIANNRQKSIDLHVLLLDDIIILLQKQDEKYVLKFYNPSLSPIIKVSTVLVRLNAVDKTALFLVNTSHNGAQIYDLVASSISEKRKWFKHISDAADAYKQREGKNRRPELDTSDTANDKCEKEKEGDDSLEGACGGELLSPPKSSNGPENSPSGTPAPSTPPTPQPGSPALTTSKLDGVSSGNERKTDDIQIASYASFSSETTLIDPGEVIVSSRDVLTAEPVLTPLEKLKRKDELVRRTLYEKQAIVADILHVPREEFDNIVELAGEPAIDKEPSELVLAAVSQVHELTLVINEALKVTEEETVALTAESGTGTKLARLPGIPAYKVQGIASSLTTQLSQLLSIMVERDEERERLRRELQKSREQLHALHEKYDQNGPSVC
ncbi:rho guanine nucleotide exchange factor 11 isoform X3 [Cimex lectularius]|uniref:Rho guanine nucleotide exchange factor 12 n=1 Tax=Cimex lectularius TaxID=79782 RepID=A0A8I6THJ9_CIMLE|nr:rho guanine nucleotide exchange factor 11 isoform X3 [Cimex lectularius]